MHKYYHFCPDWDFMQIDETSPEFECCTCDKSESKMSVKAKFFCDSKKITAYEGVEVEFSVVDAGDANKDWSKYTPSGSIKMFITNPPAFEFFVPGKKYYLTFDAE